MSAYRHEQEKMVEVAFAHTAAEAEVIRMTLIAHGFDAALSPAAAGYPSVDFVEGRGVLVRMADEHRVRDILRKLATAGGGRPNEPDR
ncbi:MAG TPA: hypothetical protein VJ922_08630 [Actinomycetota bacterium]|nr:hypothetical protein [Actinomycetota bacterium]